jgi:hypothetical protein
MIRSITNYPIAIGTVDVKTVGSRIRSIGSPLMGRPAAAWSKGAGTAAKYRNRATRIAPDPTPADFLTSACTPSHRAAPSCGPGGWSSRALLHRRITVSRQAGLMRRRPARVPTPRSAFTGYRFPPDLIMIAVRWYLRYGLSYRDVEELLAERGIEVDHVTIYRWVQRFTPLLINAARPCRHSPGDRWFVDETYVKVAGRWIYLTEQSTSSARSSTSAPHRNEIWRPPVGSSPRHSSTAHAPPR